MLIPEPNGGSLAAVAAVIPAYDEADAIGAVLAAMPASVCGVPLRTIVVDDGSMDATAAVAAAHPGVVVRRLGSNQGQGAALRAGYAEARSGGADVIVTLDADGQWAPEDIETVAEPVLAGRADLVLGSRVLGDAEAQAGLRRAGVRVFSVLVGALTGTRVTDTSSGLRAMTAELTRVVPQQEPQYQAAELLLGALACGFRVVERPVRMRRRVAGTSKKGRDVLYGARYARVLLRSWWRGRRVAAAS